MFISSVRTALVALALFGSGLVVSAQPAQQTKPFAVIEFSAARVAYVQVEAAVADGKVQMRVKDANTVPTRLGFAAKGKLEEQQIQEAAGNAAAIYLDLLKGKQAKADPEKGTRAVNRAPVQAENIWIVMDSHIAVRSTDEQSRVIRALNEAIDDQIGDDIKGWRAWRDSLPGKSLPVTLLDPRKEAQYRTYELQQIDANTADYTLIDVAPGGTTIAYKRPHLEGALPALLTDRQWIAGSLEVTNKIRDTVDEKAFKTEFTKHLSGLLEKDVGSRFYYNRDTRVGFANRDRHYVIGDMASALPVLLKPESVLKSPKEILITAEDIIKFEELVTKRDKDGNLIFPKLVLPPEATSETKKTLEDEYKLLRDTYSTEQLAAAAGILRQWSDAFGLKGEDKVVYVLRGDGEMKDGRYVRNSQYVLATGFLRFQLQKYASKATKKE